MKFVGNYLKLKTQKDMEVSLVFVRILIYIMKCSDKSLVFVWEFKVSNKIAKQW